MHKSERLFYLWKLIEKIAFRPAKDKIVDWLYCYGQFLHHFWQTSDYTLCEFVPHRHLQKIDGFVHYPPLSLKYEFQLEFSLNKHAIQIEFDKCTFHYDYDDNYFNELACVEQKWSVSGKNKNILNNIKGEDIEKILEGIVAHPAIHQHIGYNNFPRWIRIGTTIKNPFLFLYQFAFQLGDCYQDFRTSVLKKEEFKRLKNLFFDYLGDKRPKAGYLPIGPGKLFNL